MHRTENLVGNAYLLLMITALFWSGNAIAGKLAVGHISPFLLTQLRWAIVCLVLLPFAWPHLKRDAPLIRENIMFLFILGATGFAFFNNLMYLALNHTTAINVAIEQSSMPLVVFVVNYILFRTRITVFQVTGFVITLAGVAITITRGDLLLVSSQKINIGDTMMICAIIFFGVYSVLLRSKPKIHLLSLLFMLGFSAFLATLPLTAYEYITASLRWPDMQGWGAVLYAALLPSLVSQFFWIMGLEKIGSNRGGIFVNLVPIFGALLAVLILGEKFQTYHAIGLILVLGGITLAQKKT